VLPKTLRAPKTPRACQNHEKQLETDINILRFPVVSRDFDKPAAFLVPAAFLAALGPLLPWKENVSCMPCWRHDANSRVFRCQVLDSLSIQRCTQATMRTIELSFNTTVAKGGGGGASARSNVALLVGGSGGGGNAVAGFV
jgi:hypothetical protein